jgi:hypothetical protein
MAGKIPLLDSIKYDNIVVLHTSMNQYNRKETIGGVSKIRSKSTLQTKTFNPL